MSVIATDKLTKYYGEARGIVDVDLKIEAGEIFGFIGPNGAGKSTTIRLLLALIYPTSGSATIFGKDVIDHGPEIKKDIGYLPSEVFYYDDMKAADLLKYSGSFYPVGKKAIEKRMYELAELLDLDLNRKIDDLSYGNKKKVGIIQGLLHRPKLIMLDEPTGGLDPLMQQKFFNLLKEENRRGATILFSSHILPEVQKICDRVAIIKEGKIVRTDALKGLIGDNYKRLKLDFLEKPERKLFETLGISDLKLNKLSASFLYKGDLNRLMSLLSQVKLTNLLVEDPDLEEIFMHYYGA